MKRILKLIVFLAVLVYVVYFVLMALDTYEDRITDTKNDFTDDEKAEICQLYGLTLENDESVEEMFCAYKGQMHFHVLKISNVTNQEAFFKRNKFENVEQLSSSFTLFQAGRFEPKGSKTVYKDGTNIYISIYTNKVSEIDDFVTEHIYLPFLK